MADDFTYWNIAFDVYEKGVAGWQKSSFHALRWPVWGLCWVIQKVAGLGLGAYLGVGLVYLAAGAVVCFQLGRLARIFHRVIRTHRFSARFDAGGGHERPPCVS